MESGLLGEYKPCIIEALDYVVLRLMVCRTISATRTRFCVNRLPRPRPLTASVRADGERRCGPEARRNGAGRLAVRPHGTPTSLQRRPDAEKRWNPRVPTVPRRHPTPRQWACPDTVHIAPSARRRRPNRRCRASRRTTRHTETPGRPGGAVAFGVSTADRRDATHVGAHRNRGRDTSDERSTLGARPSPPTNALRTDRLPHPLARRGGGGGRRGACKATGSGPKAAPRHVRRCGRLSSRCRPPAPPPRTPPRNRGTWRRPRPHRAPAPPTRTG